MVFVGYWTQAVTRQQPASIRRKTIHTTSSDIVLQQIWFLFSESTELNSQQKNCWAFLLVSLELMLFLGGKRKHAARLLPP